MTVRFIKSCQPKTIFKHSGMIKYLSYLIWHFHFINFSSVKKRPWIVMTARFIKSCQPKTIFKHSEIIKYLGLPDMALSFY